MEDHVRLLGKFDDATLEAAYFAADAHVFPVLDLPGDVEGFGMVALEAAAHGLPSIAFAVGGVPDAVAEGTTGRLVGARAYGAFSEAIIQALRTPYTEDLVRRCHEHASVFAWPRFEERFLKLLQDRP
jgi:phosphatidylinositol alpha-1,6-mannosyltransferase